MHDKDQTGLIPVIAVESNHEENKEIANLHIADYMTLLEELEHR